MKVIDLLNKIAKGEIPKTIVYNEKYLTYDEKRQNYFSYDDSEIDWKYTVMEYINDEVEIIEEPQEHKIPKKLNEELASNDDMLYKLNEIIDYLQKQLNKQKEVLDKIKELINHYAIENEDYSKIYNQEEKDILELLEELK